MHTIKLAILGLVAVFGVGCAGSGDEESEEVVAGESNLESAEPRELTVEQARAKVVAAGYFRDRSDLRCGHDLTIRSEGDFKYSERACTPGAPFEYWEGTWSVSGGWGSPTLKLNPVGFSLSWSYSIEVVAGKVRLTRGSEVMTPNGS